MPLTIHILTGQNSPWTRVFDQDEITIGRAPAADVRLHPSDTVCGSGTHARVVRQGSQWFVEVNHENGVFVAPLNGERARIGKGQRASLGEDQEMTIGRNGPKLRLTTQAAAPAQSAIAPMAVRILTGYHSPWQAAFDKDLITIGRGEKADVRLHPTRDTACARDIHARLLRKGAHWFVEARHESGLILRTSRRARAELKAGQRAALEEETDITLGQRGPMIRVTPPLEAGYVPYTCAADEASYEPPPIGGIPMDEITREGSKQMRRWGVLVGGGSLVAAVVIGAMTWASVPRSEETRLRRALQEAQSSVYMAGIIAPDGSFIPGGTAWAVADGKLATNAHVVEALRAHQNQGLKLIARLPGNPPRDLTITDLEIHPGYEHLEPLLNCAFKDRSGTMTQSIGLFDVGLIDIDGDVGRPLSLASDDDLRRLRPGQAIGYVGYPMENLWGAKGNQPSTTITGSITSLQDALGQSAPFEHQNLLQHNVANAGGASGSPMLTASGQVVALNHAGHMMFLPDGRRFSIGLNLAQRVNLLREMLEGTADQKLPGYERYVRQAYRDMGVMPEDVTVSVLGRRLFKAVENGEFEQTPSVNELVGKSEVLNKGTRSLVHTLNLRQNGRYLLAACTADFSELRVELLHGQSSQGDSKGLCPMMDWKAPAHGAYTVRIVPTEAAKSSPRIYLHVVELGSPG